MQPRHALFSTPVRLLTMLTIVVLTQFAAAAGVDDCTTTLPGDVDGDGFSPATGDCNEDSALQNPGAVELCDGFDNDCDGILDDVPFCHPECATYAATASVSVTDVLIADSVSYVSDSMLVADTRIAALWHLDQGFGVSNYGYWLTTFERDGGNPWTAWVGASTSIDMVWTGEQFGLVGAIAFSDGDTLPWFQRIGADGTTPPPLNVPERAKIAWTGTEFVLAFDATLQRFDRDGVAVGSPIPFPEGRIWKMLAVEDHLAAVVESGSEFKFMRFRIDGTLLGPPQVLNVQSFFFRSRLRLVWTGKEYIAAWQEGDGPERPVRLARFDASGIELDQQTISPVASTAELRDVVWNGRHLAVLYKSGVGLQLLDSTGNPVAIVADSRAATWDGGGWPTVGFGRLVGDEYYEIRLLYTRRTCACTDEDGDGMEDCFDCDDADAAVFPGAPQICDGVNNDCDHPGWPALDAIPENEDDDLDGWSECAGDCDDANPDTYSGAPQICDGVNNDCDDAAWPEPPASEVDGDADGAPACVDCDDADPRIYPGAEQACDGVNNDCDATDWSPVDEADQDGDGFRVCNNDCQDTNAAVNPCAEEFCNGQDEDCDTLIDEDELGEDADGDGSRALCDNCPMTFNPAQLDADDDLIGDTCDNCPVDINADQADEDDDTLGDACDPCLGDPVNDPDLDLVCHTVDNCPAIGNADQSDLDQDGAGDVCDVCPADATDDADADGTCEDADNCPGLSNPDQYDPESDGLGALCDNCPEVSNVTQEDADGDGAGDACDACTDPDGDGFGFPGVPASLCPPDNCPGLFNADQSDVDHDVVGDLCDNCPWVPNPGQEDADLDVTGDACDNCPIDFNFEQSDIDRDGPGDVCDNCPAISNVAQTDIDADFEGNICDADDDWIYLHFGSSGRLDWPAEAGIFAWNVYRSDLELIKAASLYTQPPGSNPIALRACGLSSPSYLDTAPLGPGQVAAFLVAGRDATTENELGPDSEGTTRPNDNPCP